MNLNTNHRWEMQTNPHVGPVPPMSPVTELELMEHSMVIDTICDGKRFSADEMQECRDRLRRFCWIQWLNREN